MSKGYKPTSKKQSYDDTYNGIEDIAIKKILFGRDDSNSDKIRKMKKVLYDVIQNELTERQREFIEFYFYDGMNTIEIAQKCSISPQAVSAVLIRAKRRMYKVMKYYLL
ncbi:MAG: sigma-70 family RNA polymerase sigma factor [Ruminococcus sp.]|nr:sigma-70 family RNA polymerase sigma factor [Ruminococcus sp.]